MDESLNPTAAMHAPSQKKALTTFTENVVGNMTGNVYFPSPNPTLADVTAANQALAQDDGKALNRGKGAAQQRNATRAKLMKLLRALLAYVQSIADQQTSRDAAIAVITSSGFGVKKYTKPSKAEFSVTQGDVSGSVDLSVLALGTVASHYWQFSSNQKDWTSVPETLQTTTTITGLTPLTTYYFRFKRLTRTGMSDWSPSTSLLVL